MIAARCAANRYRGAWGSFTTGSRHWDAQQETETQYGHASDHQHSCRCIHRVPLFDYADVAIRSTGKSAETVG